MPNVVFVPFNKTKRVKAGATILAAANQADVPIGQSCSGDGICGWCKVTVVSGTDNLAPPTKLEAKLIAEKLFGQNERAACLAIVRGDVAVTTSYW
ncbi:MAG: (2Fe-2S)-binding protein [Bacteroidetes bacterium]|nr:(2Fe-2S)-binding protein [Bacteroidota bacterium]MCW5896154.1 (2Fe-2S)-binding protein [Bacteroidota bacterium]